MPISNHRLVPFADGKVTFRWRDSAHNNEQAQSDVDLFIVGRVALADLGPGLRRVERQFDREVNVTRYSENEFREKLNGGDHFLKSVIKGKLITLMGSLNELKKAAGRK